MKSGIKQDTLASLCQAPMDLPTLFPDSILKKAEDDISKFEDKGYSHASISGCKDSRYDPYKRADQSSYESKSGKPVWKNIGRAHKKKGRIQTGKFSSRQAKGQSAYKWQSMCNLLVSKQTDREQATDTRTDNKLFSKDTWKASCCKYCTYYTRAFTKERCKSWRVRWLSKLQIKICERCFLCRSIVFCKACNKCQTCCLKSACRGQTSKLLEKLAGFGCRSESSSYPQRGLHSPLLDPAELGKISHNKLLCQSPQEPLPVGGITSAYRQKRSRASKQSKISGVFQLAVFSAQTQQQVETYTRSEQFEPIPQGAKIQNGDTGNHQDLPPTRGVGDLNSTPTSTYQYRNNPGNI